jgi:hypothetical protein
MSNTEAAVEKQRPAHLFKPGQSGNPAGRPKGSRGKLTEDFLLDLRDAWSQYGAGALARCAEEEPAQFCRIISNLLPKDVNLNMTAEISVGDFAQQFRDACAMLGNDVPLRKPLRGIASRVIEHEKADAGHRR